MKDRFTRQFYTVITIFQEDFHESKNTFSFVRIGSAFHFYRFFIASMVFIFVFKDPSPVPVFILFGTVNVVNMILYALAPAKFKKLFQHISRAIIGGTLLFFGIAGMQNFQIEGLWFSIFAGVLTGVIVHYMMGKILVPVIFGRTWCAWSCWTILFLDLLPFKKSRPWQKGMQRLRYIHFALSFALCAVLVFGFRYLTHYMGGYDHSTGMGNRVILGWFIAGNIAYYSLGIILAILMKDNRAFCKYLCPVSIFLKLSNMPALLRIRGDAQKCNQCQSCVNACPMHIDIPSFIRKGSRVVSTECIMCMSCIAACPQQTLRASAAIDLGVFGGYKISD